MPRMQSIFIVCPDYRNQLQIFHGLFQKKDYMWPA